VLCRLYDLFYGYQEAEIFPLFISSLLEPTWGPLSRAPEEAKIGSYLEIVLSSYELLKEQLGSDRLPVHHGKIFDVISLAERIIKKKTLENPNFEREKFEAPTETACTPFFNQNGSNPPQATSLLNSFLLRPDLRHYQPGKRLFFGKLVP